MSGIIALAILFIANRTESMGANDAFSVYYWSSS